MHHFVAELRLRHLHCYSVHLDCGNLFLHYHGIVNYLVHELRLGQLDCLLNLLDKLMTDIQPQQCAAQPALV